MIASRFLQILDLHLADSNIDFPRHRFKFSKGHPLYPQSNRAKPGYLHKKITMPSVQTHETNNILQKDRIMSTTNSKHHN